MYVDLAHSLLSYLCDFLKKENFNIEGDACCIKIIKTNKGEKRLRVELL
ncbi:MAG: hypothetical protein K0R71_2037 [Bacillales bacterium]|jgi:hypothetical protein|nr:hypothetical protein [Bacillales bacterium]